MKNFIALVVVLCTSLSYAQDEGKCKTFIDKSIQLEIPEHLDSKKTCNPAALVQGRPTNLIAIFGRVLDSDSDCQSSIKNATIEVIHFIKKSQLFCHEHFASDRNGYYRITTSRKLSDTERIVLRYKADGYQTATREINLKLQPQTNDTLVFSWKMALKQINSTNETEFPDDMSGFIKKLMSKMTLEEKIGQLNLLTIGFDVTGPIVSQNVNEKISNGLVGAVLNTYTPQAVRALQELTINSTRLKIPLIFGYDVIHGHRTIFPIPLGISCTWDMSLIEKSAIIAAQEATADGLNWVFSPMVDIARDPRWGRISEGSGEDPWLGSQIAAAMVRGYQGEDLAQSNTVMACVKHFALYGAAEAGRDYNTVDMSRISMYQNFLPPYRAAVEAGVGSVMTAFNEIDSVPATANHWLLDTVLRQEWNFGGFVVTDYTSINEMEEHGLGNLQEVSARALDAGVDMDMVGEGFLKTLKNSLKEGKINEESIDRACYRVLEAKYKLGLFEDPFRYCDENRPQSEILTDDNRLAAKQIALNSFVLLKNDRKTLPLPTMKANIALIGPLADDKRNLIGDWSAAGDWKKAVSVLEGITNLMGNKIRLRYAKGSNLVEDPMLLEFLNAHRGDITLDGRSAEEMIDEAVKVANQSDIVVAVVGETLGMTGEAASRADIGIPQPQKDLLKALFDTGKPVVIVLMNGRPMTLTWEHEHAAAILETWFAGTEAGNAIAETLFGRFNPSGKLTATFPRHVGQIPIYYNHKNTGRPFDSTKPLTKYESRYLDIPNDPLYSFGHGLSYTQFKFGPIIANKNQLYNNKDQLVLRVNISNDGLYAGAEVVQLYISDPAASVTRAVRELKSFQKIFLKSGEKEEVTFVVTTNELKFYNENLDYDWEAGEFIIHIGPDSVNTQSVTVNWSK